MRPSLTDDRRVRGEEPAEQVGPARRRSSLRAVATAPGAQAGAMALGACALLIALTWSLFADAPRLAADFPTGTWLIKHQADALGHGLLPSLFLHADTGVFYPVFTFYGGTLFAFAGGLALVLGSATAAQATVYVLALAAAYGGWLWLARMAGLRSWQTHMPAVLYVTAPYVMTNVYVRQDLTETVATAVVPLLLASALSVLRADRLRAGPVAALAVTTVTVGGSHNLTLLWGTTLLGLVALALAVSVPQARGLVTRGGVLRVLAVVVPAMAVNSWYLLPDLAYHSHTVIVGRIDEWRRLLASPGPAVDAKYLFALGRPTAFPGSGLSVTLPVLAIAWVLTAAVTVGKQWREPWARTLVIIALASIVLVVVMRHPGLITWLPDPWLMLQFSYRLESFILFGICGAVIAAQVLLNHVGRRWLSTLLIPIAAVSIAVALHGIGQVPRAPEDFVWTIDNYIMYSFGDYADGDADKIAKGRGAQPLTFTRADVRHNQLETTVAAQPGQILYANLMTLPQMIDVEGARVVGRWMEPATDPGWQGRWSVALQVDDDATPGEAHITVRGARTLPIVGGRILSALGLLGLAAIAAVIARAGLRRRRSER